MVQSFRYQSVSIIKSDHLNRMVGSRVSRMKIDWEEVADHPAVAAFIWPMMVVFFIYLKTEVGL